MGEMKRSIPELSVDTQVLMRALREVAVGETIAYADLSKLISRDVQGRARGLLNTARRRLELDEQMVFAPVIGEGLKREDDMGILAMGQRDIQHIRSTARKVTRRCALVDYDKLPAEAKRTHNVVLAQAGVLAYMTKAPVVKQLEKRVPDVPSTSPARVLEALKEIL